MMSQQQPGRASAGGQHKQQQPAQKPTNQKRKQVSSTDTASST